jgi:FkbM family methyltransferase
VSDVDSAKAVGVRAADPDDLESSVEGGAATDETGDLTFTESATVEELQQRIDVLNAKLLKSERKLELEILGGKTRDRRGRRVLLDYPKADITLLGAAKGRRIACAKEPLTVSWIERSLRAGDVFYDIGANVGSYSLVAAASSHDSVRIFAFEPGFENFSALCQHLIINGFEDRIIPVPMALGAQTALAKFSYRFLTPGGARHFWTQSEEDAPFESLYNQTILTYRLDDLVSQFELTPPTHIKLDVDGAERAVLTGAERVLRAERLRSVLIEVPQGADDVTPLLADAGLHLAETFEEYTNVWYGVFERN